MKHILLFSAIFMASLTSFSQKAMLTIDMDTPSVDYSPMIFGGFLEHFDSQVYGGVFDPGSPLSDKDGFRKDVIEAIKELKVPVIRWPGGCYVDGYHWQDGVRKNRQPKDDIVWGVVEPHTFGTDEFVGLCRRVGAEPYICQNGLADIQEMADWVEYCNATKGKFADMRKDNGYPNPFNVKIWSVGNERDGAEYFHRVHDGARAMKQVDPSILVTCSGTWGENGKVDPYLFQAAGQYLDYISVHEYWVGNWRTMQYPDFLSCIMRSENPEIYIQKTLESLHKAGYRGRIKNSKPNPSWR
jgi:alpha-N-arabinofuranosidase